MDVDNRMACGYGYADDFCWLAFVWIGFRRQQGGFLIWLCGWLWMATIAEPDRPLFYANTLCMELYQISVLKLTI